MEKFEKAVDVLKEKCAKDIIECSIPRSREHIFYLSQKSTKMQSLYL